MNVLVLSPGVPTELNSGLGLVANALTSELRSLVSLTVVQPNAKSIDTTIEESTIEVETVTEVFSTENIVQQDFVINVSAHLDPYHYGFSNEETSIHSERGLIISEEIASYTRQVITKTKRIVFDVIYAHDWVTLQTAIALKEKTGKPFVAHVHSLDYDRGAARYRSFVFDIEKEGLAKADAIIAVSNYTAGILVKHYGIDAKKIKVVHNAITPFTVPVVKRVMPEKLILFIGRLSKQKGPELFLEIANALSRKRKDVRFVVAGAGDLYQELVEQSTKSLKTKLHFTGHISFQELKELLAVTDVYCMPSVSEPFGLSALEAAVAGVPVVLSKNSGAAEVLEGAFLADPMKSDTFVNHINVILDDDILREQAIEENLESVRPLTWHRAAAEVLKVFKRVEKK